MNKPVKQKYFHNRSIATITSRDDKN